MYYFEIFDKGKFVELTSQGKLETTLKNWRPKLRLHRISGIRPAEYPVQPGLRIRIRIRSDPECFALIRIRFYHSGSGSDPGEEEGRNLLVTVN